MSTVNQVGKFKEETAADQAKKEEKKKKEEDHHRQLMGNDGVFVFELQWAESSDRGPRMCLYTKVSLILMSL